MLRMKNKGVLLSAIVFCVFMAPTVLIAGGDLQDRLQKKLNAPSKIQFQQQGAVQSEPYYLEDKKVIGFEGAEGRKNKPKLRQAKDEVASANMEAEAIINPASSPVLPRKQLISPYAIYKADYTAEIEDDVVTVNGKVIFEVFQKAGISQIPLVRSDVGLIDVSVNKGASFVTAQAGKYYLIIDKPGRYNLDIEFLIKATRERENGPGNFNLEVMPAPISQFEFIMPEAGVEIFVEPAIKVELKKQPQKTIAWAIMPNTNVLTVRWTKALPKETITPVKLEPKVYVDAATYVVVGDGFLRAQTNLNYSILQSEIPVLRIALPEDVSILEVQGSNLRDWKVSNKDGMQYVDAYLNFGVKGNYILNVSYEKKIGEGSVVAQIPWIKTQGAEREKGFLGLAAATNVELAVNKIEQANLVDVKELPPLVWRSSANPILLAFKYLNSPFSIAIDVTRHEELSVLVAAIDSLDCLTLQTDEGKSLTKVVYQVRNNVKQFIHLVLPQDAALWSAFVAGKPVKPAKDKNGAILIPLEKSQQSDQGISQFPVEVVYLGKLPKMGPIGNLKLNLPQADIPISRLNWSVYLPLDYLYFNFGGDVKEQKGPAAPVRLFSKVSRVAAEAPLKSQYEPQLADLFEKFESAQMRGVLPIKIDIPEQGRLYRFTKLLVTEKESPGLSVSFVIIFKRAWAVFKFLFVIAVLFLAVIFIKKFLNRKSQNLG